MKDSRLWFIRVKYVVVCIFKLRKIMIKIIYLLLDDSELIRNHSFGKMLSLDFQIDDSEIHVIEYTYSPVLRSKTNEKYKRESLNISCIDLTNTNG